MKQLYFLVYENFIDNTPIKKKIIMNIIYVFVILNFFVKIAVITV